MKSIFITLLSLSVVFGCVGLLPPPTGEIPAVTPAIGFGALVGFDQLPLLTDWPAHQSSSYHPANINQDAGNFLRVEKNGDQVLTDTAGPGVVYRIWSTGVVAKQMGKDCRLRFYFDHEEEPRLDLSMAELFGDKGSRWPFVPPLSETFASGKGEREGPCNLCYTPLPFAKHLKIVGRNVMFYHVDYHRLPVGTPVESFSYGYAEKNRAAWEAAAVHFRGVGKRPGEPKSDTSLALQSRTLKPAETADFVLTGCGQVDGIKLQLARPTPEVLRGVVMEISFDGAANVCVRVPVGDFFGSGCGDNHFKSLPCGMTPTGYYAYWPMPFRISAKVTLRNGTDEPVLIRELEINWHSCAVPKNAAYFHARYIQNPNIPLDQDYRILETKGRGKLVGVQVSMQNTGKAQGIFFLEGDEKIYVDGEKYPSRWLGTGAEDYFNGAYFWNAPDKKRMARPYGGLTFLDWDIGRVCAYRWHITDQVNFKTDIIVDLEHGGVSEVPCNYQSVAYYYLEKPKAQPALPPWHKRLPKTHLGPTPKDLCCKLVGTPILGGEPLKRRPFSALSPRVDSGESIFWGQGKRGDSLQTKLLVPGEDNFELTLFTPAGPVYGDLDVGIDGKALGQIKANGDRFSPWLRSKFGPLRLAAGAHALTLKFKGEAALVDDPAIGVVAVQLQPQSPFIDKWSIIGNWPCPKDGGWDIPYAVEREQDPSRSYTLKNGKVAKWRPYGGTHVNLGGGGWLVAYGLTYIHSPDGRTVPCFITKDDGLKIWLNNRVVFDKNTWSHPTPDQFYCDLPLQKGWNKVCVKCANWFGGWSFALRPGDPDQVLEFSRRPVPGKQ